jgi:hypothetical protein
MGDITQDYKDITASLFAPANAAEASTVNNIAAVRKLWVMQAADATIMNTTGAAVATNEASVTQLFVLDPMTDYRMVVQSYRVAATGDITAANTDFATFDLMFNNGNGGAFTTIASANTENKSGSLGAVTANIPASVTVNTAAAAVPAGSQVIIRVSKSGAGKKLPQLTHVVRVEPI